MNVMNIRQATEADQRSIWEIFREVVSSGDTYVFDPEISREDAMAYWYHASNHVYVAEVSSKVVGTFIIKPNQPGLGGHVANASFMVSSTARGMGLGEAMGKHALSEARRIGFRAMQFNIVVATNEVAVRLWQRLGFQIVGTLPGAYQHSKLGYVDAYVMYQTLV